MAVLELRCGCSDNDGRWWHDDIDYIDHGVTELWAWYAGSCRLIMGETYVNLRNINNIIIITEVVSSELYIEVL